MDTEVTPAEAPQRRPDRTLVVVLTVIVVLVIVAVVVVLSRGSAPLFAEDTPEGVVQRYAQAVTDEDAKAAKGYLTPQVAAGCADDGLGAYYDYGYGSPRLTLIDSRISGTSAQVNVAITTSYDYGFLGGSRETHDDRFTLDKLADGWRIVETPYEYMICEPRN